MAIDANHIPSGHANCIMHNPHTETVTIFSGRFMNFKYTHWIINITLFTINKMSILSHFLKYITANALIVVLGLESLIYGYLKLTILFVKMLFQKIQQVEVKPVK